MGLADRIRSAAAAGLELVADAIAPAKAAPTIAAEPPVALSTRPAILAGYQPEPQPAPKLAPKTSPLIEIVTLPSRYDYAENFAGWSLTPERIAWILRQADLGEPWQMIDMIESGLLNDGHTRGLWEQRMDEVAGQSWSVRPPPGDASQGSADVATLLNEAVQPIDISGFVEHTMLATGYGFSYAECAWQTRSDGLQVPVEIVCVPHRRFRFDHLLSRPHLVSETDPFPGALLERTPGSSWIRAETRRWRKQTQAGILRTAIWWICFKRMSVRDWLIFAEKFGIPMIIGQYGNDSTEATRAALLKAIEALGTEGRAILKDDAKVTIQDTALRAGGGDHLHAAITQLCNSEISKILTSATLTSDVGGPGSFALGQVHADQKHKLSLADARRVGAVFQQYIGREFLIRNGLVDKAQAPWLHIHVQKLSRLVDANVVKTLANAGLKLSISQLREMFEFRAPSSPDDELKTPEKPDASTAPDPSDPREPADSPDA